MTNVSFDPKTLSVAGDGHGGDVGGPVSCDAGPSLVTLESGVQALVQIASFTYVDGLPLAIGCGLDEDVNATKALVSSSDGVKLERVVST
ncbi:hypothetical protein [Erythrobacter sp.]|uniref:hypothetical protein n=1 Tax=Erythrobacter sp. TaxID=1042 RepID=UPI001425D5DB|nr:hypothetical protein [Erythrobacter sp.]QIQ87362.1 MAG: hypothetical protein G9473_12195 [Erythrobacter sp.]